MTKRSSHTLTRNHENRLSQVKIGSSTEEQYLYDDSGQRVKKWNGSSVVYYPNAFYEVETGNGSVVASQAGAEAGEKVEESRSTGPSANAIFLPLVQGAAEADIGAASLATNVVKYYFFNGHRVAMKDGSTWIYLHSDHLGGTVSTTNTSGNQASSQSYYAYGSKRGGTSMTTDRQYTGQQKDQTGLYYYNARYYDPALGQFVSPDTIVPDPENVFAYNRYMYVFGSPINYNDPTGHCPWCVTAGIGALAGGAFTSVVYLASTPYADWEGAQLGAVAAAGAVGGALIGTGVGVTAGTASMSAALTAATSASVASGVGTLTSAGSYMISNSITDSDFDTSDFVTTSAIGGLEGAAASVVPGGGLAAGATRTGISGAFGFAESAMQQSLNGDDVQLGAAVHAGFVAGAAGTVGDMWSGGFRSPSILDLRNPRTSQDFVPTTWLDSTLNARVIGQAIREHGSDVPRPFIRNVGIDVGATAFDQYIEP